jgi:hypothetical protein
MKHLLLEVKSPQSYVTYLRLGTGVKPQVPLPFQVPLDPGGYLELAVDDNKYCLQGQGHNLRFTTDKLEQDPSDWITGELQQMSVMFSDLALSYDPKTGKIYSGGGYTYVQGVPSYGGCGALGLWYLGPSKLRDVNSPSFDLSNGLGCGGGVLLEMGTGNPTDFIVHLETDVAMEDVDGDGSYETECWSAWKYVKLLYRPPKLKVIWPELPPLPPPNPWMVGMYKIKVSALVEMARKGRGPLKGAPGITRVEIGNGSRVGVVLYDQDGSVLSGDMSERSIKAIQIDPSLDFHVSFLS